MPLEVQVKQLTEEWFNNVLAISKDEDATEREKQLAMALRDCGRVLNHLLLALHNAEIVSDSE